ncbi:MAG: undecaprenyl/decaprenyl-phosphate alpha-N-acetylglucosaminyl 1-phosphate transferase [Candidatus Omnitrophica bacterium]|nr:undecaprenyl/decaprenyl-phosphate alpha-N-acetylglucosaminyl 1-phosphate transferase [Candidatus Omnitrophota bacterium]
MPIIISKFLLIFLVSTFLTWWMQSLAKVRGFLLDNGIPMVGGLAVSAALLGVLPVVTFPAFLDKRMFFIATWSLTVLCFGILDDLRAMSVWQKFLWQSVCAAGLLFSGVNLHLSWLGPWGSFALGFIWLVGLTNALNLLDVSDGVCTGVALVSAAGIALLSFLSGRMEIYILMCGLAMALAGFWSFNLPPARAYLGNAGSHFLGFLFAAVTLVLLADASDVRMFTGVLFVLWFPLLETAVLVVSRVGKGMSPLQKSPDHLALRLGARGLGLLQVSATITGLALLFTLAGVASYSFHAPVLDRWLVAGVITISIILIRYLFFTESNGK